MTSEEDTKGLVVLVADKNIEFVIKGLATRNRSLRVRQFSLDVYVHPERDPGCLLKGDTFLRQFVGRHSHALVIFDREGCGREQLSREDLESHVETRLVTVGWTRDRSAALVLDPELEIWVWSGSTHVDNVLGWKGRTPSLKSWLQSNNWTAGNEIKPAQPRPALDEALRLAGKPRSSAIYLQLAQKVSLERCSDPSFLKLKSLFRQWFPAS